MIIISVAGIATFGVKQIPKPRKAPRQIMKSQELDPKFA